MKVCGYDSPGQVEPGSLLLRLSWDQTSYNCLHKKSHWDIKLENRQSLISAYTSSLQTQSRHARRHQQEGRRQAAGTTNSSWSHWLLINSSPRSRCSKLLPIVAYHWICVHLVIYPFFEQLCGTAEVGGLLFGRNDGKDELDFIKGPFWQTKTTDVVINPIFWICWCCCSCRSMSLMSRIITWLISRLLYLLYCHGSQKRSKRSTFALNWRQ